MLALFNYAFIRKHPCEVARLASSTEQATCLCSARIRIYLDASLVALTVEVPLVEPDHLFFHLGITMQGLEQGVLAPTEASHIVPVELPVQFV
jgi:hypothetical protein